MTPVLQQELEEILSEPVSSVIERERNSLDRLLEACGRKVVIFGAGSLGRRSLACLRSIGVEPLAFSDNNPKLWGTELDGLAVLPPIAATDRFGGAALFLVTIWTAHHRFVDTRQQLSELGASSIAPGAAIYWRFPEIFLPYFAQDLPHKVYEQAEQATRARDLWSDSRSHQTYVSQIKWRALGDYSDLAAPEPETYFPPDLVSLSADEDLVDCGAFDGDTIRSFLAHCGEGFRSITAVEPDAISFSRLQSYVDRLTSPIGHKIKLLHCAVASEAGMLRFEDTGGVNSRPSPKGGSLIPAMRLDDLFDVGSVTYIKMDVEGFEVDALMGARRVIQRDRPVLAICVYHRQDHLWRIPLLIKEINPDYRLYLRMYECEGWQTVAYAVPPERAFASAR